MNENSIRKCSVTGLNIREKSEWNHISLGNECFVSFSLIGENILLVKPEGRFEKDALEKIFFERVGILPQVTSPFCELIDFSRFSIRMGIDWKFFAGYYSDFCRGLFDVPGKPEKILIGLLGFNAPLSLKLAVNRGRTGLRKESPLYIMSGYSTAVNESVNALSLPGQSS